MTVNRFAIVGLGSIGKRHLRILREIKPDAEITVVRSGLGEYFDELKLADHITNDINDILEFPVHIAIISSPANFHIEQAIKLAEKGTNILIEKPLSVNSNGLEVLEKIIKDRNLVASVGYVFRHDKTAIKFKECIKKHQKKINYIRVETGSYLPNWRPGKDYLSTVSSRTELGGGALLELSHEIDYSHWFFNIKKIHSGYTYNSNSLDLNVEDGVEILALTIDNIPISIHMDFHSKRPYRKTKIFGIDYDLVWDSLNKSIKINKHEDNSIEEISFSYDMDDSYKQQLVTFIYEVESCIKDNKIFNDSIQIMNFIEKIKWNNL